MSDYKNEQEIIESLDNIRMDKVSIYSFLSLGWISFLSSAIIIFTFIKYPNMRKAPGGYLIEI